MTHQDTQPPAEDIADMSWIDIAVIRNGAVICDAAPGWLPFLDGDIHVEDVFASTVDYPTTPGLYRWSGYTVGSWQEGDGCVATGGTFTALTRHVIKDEALSPREGATLLKDWNDETVDRHIRGVRSESWTAARQPIRATPKPPAGGDAGERDHRYRPLRLGEIVLATDECRGDDGTWVTGICVGERAPDPAYTSHRVYRRLKTIDALQKALEFACLTLAFHGRDRGTDRESKMLDDLEAIARDLERNVRAALADRDPTPEVTS